MGLKKNESVKIKKPDWWSRVDWLAVRIITGALIVITGIGTGLYYALEHPNWPKSEQISKVRVGMAQDEVFTILNDKGWSFYDEKGYEYRWNFKAPSGAERVFSVIIKDGVVTDIDTY